MNYYRITLPLPRGTKEIVIETKDTLPYQAVTKDDYLAHIEWEKKWEGQEMMD